MFTYDLLKRIKSEFGKVFNFLDNTNISAAVSEMENVGALVAQYSQTRADAVYNLIDKTWEVVCKVENRVPTEYAKFKKSSLALFSGILGDYLNASDSNFKSMTLDSKSVIDYARMCNSYAFTVAKKLSYTMQTYSYKHGSDYYYYVSGQSQTNSGYQKIIELTQQYVGEVMKIAVSELNSRI